MRATQEYLDNTVLVSSYDVAHGHTLPIKDVRSLAELVFIDSGGYETSDAFDLDTVTKTYGKKKNWSLEQYRNFIQAWAPDYPAVFVSYDNSREHIHLKKQIQRTVSLKDSCPTQLWAMLLRFHYRREKEIDLEAIEGCADLLEGFHIIGVTEKELGDTMLGRMLSIARLREILDRHGISSPIHVFGSLDPISTWLYFMSGAEIFDGLTWLRYSYMGGLATYWQNFGVLEVGLDRPSKTVLSTSWVRNLAYLSNLRLEMRSYLNSGKLSNIPHKKNIQDALDKLLGEFEQVTT